MVAPAWMVGGYRDSNGELRRIFSSISKDHIEAFAAKDGVAIEEFYEQPPMRHPDPAKDCKGRNEGRWFGLVAK